MKILVCGGRDFSDYNALARHLDAANRRYRILMGGEPVTDRAEPLTHIVHGGAQGADRMAGLWARRAGIQEVRCDANWDYYSNGAGPKRNKAMLALLTRPDYVMAFPGGDGTADMIEQALRAGFTVVEPMAATISMSHPLNEDLI
jgi:hypothetical protein